MATNMAPHNLCEVIDACLLLINKEGKEYIPDLPGEN
jgi:DNA gyrase/topoisomerase IV subunit A